MRSRIGTGVIAGIVSLVLTLTLAGCSGGGGGGSAAGGIKIQGVWEGTKQLGTASFDFGWGNAVDGDGNVFVTGGTGGSLDGNSAAGDLDMILVKYNAAGEKQWTRQLGTASEDRGNAVAVDADGNIYVVGTTLGDLGGPHEGSDDAYDIFLIKYNRDGNEQWRRRLGTPEVDDAPGVAVDAGGNIYVSGTTYGDMDGDLEGINAGDFDMFLVKYNAEGTKQWTRQWGTSSSDECYGIAVDAGGNIYLTGLTYGNLDHTSAGLSDLFLVKYNAEGVRQWTRQWGTTAQDYGYGVAVDRTSGNVYVAGSTGNQNPGSYEGLWNMLLVKYDAAGELQWARQVDSGDDDEGWSVAVDTSGNVFVTGDTYGTLDGNTSAGGWDAFLVKYDAAGERLWIRQMGTDAEDAAYGVATDTDGNAFVTGYTFGGLYGNTNAGEDDVFLMKFDNDGVRQ